MKRLFKSMLMLTAVASTFVLSSCSKDEEPAKTYLAPTLVVNDGATKTNANLMVDTIALKVVGTADQDLKLSKVKITRSIQGQSDYTVTETTLSAKEYTNTFYDRIAGASVVVDEGDVIKYSITLTDEKSVSVTSTYDVTISSMATSGNIILGTPNNTTPPNGEYKFCGIADNFRRYTAGTTGTDLAKDNSAKVDFVYFWGAGGGVQNALYGPNFFTTAGVGGWETEISSWPVKNKTVFVRTPLTSSDFDALQGSTFLAEIATIDFSAATEKAANLQNQEVVAYQTASGKRGFILIAGTATSASVGYLTMKIKTEL